ncbi:MAG: hypothetical protein AABY22_31100, partial [Nanoarchaeota archaeon]
MGDLNTYSILRVDIPMHNANSQMDYNSHFNDEFYNNLYVLGSEKRHNKTLIDLIKEPEEREWQGIVEKEKRKEWKRALFCSIGVGILSLIPYIGPAKYAYSQEPVRITETESFDGSINKSNLKDPVDKWSVGASELEAVDYDEATGDGKKSGWGY